MRYGVGSLLSRCVKVSAAANLKRRIAADLVEFFGLDVIRRLLGGTQPDWVSDLRMARERGHTHEGAFLPLAQPLG